MGSNERSTNDHPPDDDVSSRSRPAYSERPAFSHRGRDGIIQRQASEHFDLLVVGGGITGAGIARDAALRGLRVALLEQGDFGSGTSSKSSKLVHGGLRYLEQLHLGLVFEATNERSRLMRHAPHLVRPLPFLFPIYRGASKGPLIVGIGLWIYDALALFRNVQGHRKLRPDDVRTLEPLLDGTRLRAAMLYYDAMTDDARLTLENVIAAHMRGAAVLNYARFEQPRRSEKGGRVVGGVAKCRLTQRTWDISAEVTVVSAGPWTDAVRKNLPHTTAEMMRPTKGVHVVVPRHRLPVQHAVVMSAVRDGRVVFALPWEESTAIGTTDTDYDGPLDEVAANRDDVDYLLETANRFFPQARLQAEDVISTWAGLRPLVKDDASSAYTTSREHTVMASDDHTVTIAGGKLTTYRKMAAECVDAAVEFLPRERRVAVQRSSTATEPLPNGDGLDWHRETNRVRKAALDATGGDEGLASAVAHHLVRTYGTQWTEVWDGHSPLRHIAPNHPALWREVDRAVEAEMALSLEDFLVRRTHLHYHLPDQGLSVANAIADRMGALLGWDAARRAAEVSRYEALVGLNRRWRQQESTHP